LVSDLRWKEGILLFGRLAEVVRTLRQEAGELADFEEENTDGLSLQEIEASPFYTWPDRKSRYRLIKKAKRIRNHIRRRLYDLGA
jgi:hypothetical protein